MGRDTAKQKVLVTGGAGFLGRAICRALLREGVEVISYSRGYYPELEAEGIRCIQGDIVSHRDLLKAASGVSAVFHTAAKAGVWGDYESYYQPNVQGTINVINICKRLSIPKLIYTSSPSVVFDGKDQEGVDETAPYPDRFLAHYPATKSLAEQLVIRANSNNLMTCSLRPHLIWGPGDNHLAPRILQKAEQGKLRHIKPFGKKVDAVYIDNAAHAHILAWKKLGPGSPVAGNTYFVTNEDPWETDVLINAIIKAGGRPPVTKSIHARLARIIGFLCESAFYATKKRHEPPLTRFTASILSTSHWYNTKKAREELGYKPYVTMEEGLDRLQASYGN